MVGLKISIRNCYKLVKLHMIVAPPMNDKIVTTAFGRNLLSFLTGRSNKFNSFARLMHFNCSLHTHPYKLL